MGRFFSHSYTSFLISCLVALIPNELYANIEQDACEFNYSSSAALRCNQNQAFESISHAEENLNSIFHFSKIPIPKRVSSKLTTLGEEVKQSTLKNLQQLPAHVSEQYFYKIYDLKCKYTSLGSCECPEAELLVKEIGALAFDLNVGRILQETACRHNIPLVIRDPTTPSKALQQNNFKTKPMIIKNKSSLVPGLEGLIPLNGQAGKFGAELLEFERKYHKELAQKDHRLMNMHDTLLQKVENETRMARELIKNHGYISAPLTRVRGKKREVLVFTDDSASNTKWIPQPSTGELGGVRTVYVLATMDGGKQVPITADTDFFMIGHPKQRPKSSLMFDPKTGIETEFTQEIRNDINRAWRTHSGNQNAIAQHGDESLFGLNPINDVLVAASGNCLKDSNGKIIPSPPVERFDLTIDQDPEIRTKNLIAYSHWIASQIQAGADIHVPTYQEQVTNLNTQLKHHSGLKFELLGPNRPACDYAIIRDAVNKQLTYEKQTHLLLENKRPTVSELCNSSPQ